VRQTENGTQVIVTDRDGKPYFVISRQWEDLESNSKGEKAMGNRKPVFKTRHVLMTKGLADRYLADHNNNNPRPLQLARVRALAAAMTAGEWIEDFQAGCTLILDESGNIVDGQTRLAAISMADVSLWWTIQDDADSSIRGVANSGKSAAPGDWIYQTGQRTNTNVLAAATKIIASFEKRMCLMSASETVMKDTFNRYKEELLCSLENPGPRHSAPVIGAFAYVRKIAHFNTDMIDALATRVSTGIDVQEGDPARMIISLKSEKKSAQHDRWGVAVRTVYLIHAHLKGMRFTRMPVMRLSNAAFLDNFEAAYVE
jgi:hypothetical protein